MSKINDEVSKCIIQMLMKEPFFAHLLSSVIRNVSKKIPTAAVGVRDGKVNLFINENFFLNELKTTSNRIAVIKHETLHLMFKHIFRVNAKKHDFKLYNYAADIVVNQFIGSNWDLPDSAITLNTFPDLNLVSDQTVEWYYKKLSDLANEMRNKQNSINNNDSNSGSNNKNAPNSSMQNSPSGNKDWSGTSSPKSASALEQIYGNITHSDHSRWGSDTGKGEKSDNSGNSDSANLKSAEDKLDRMIIRSKERTPVKDHGTIPGPINGLIDAMLEKRKPKVDWRRALRIFSTSSRRTRVVHTMKRVSKRYGTRPGIKIAHFQKIAVAIDTSGSISMEQLNLLFSEIHGMWRQGAELEIIECDARVQRHYSYRGKLPTSISGGGGTSFDPVFTFLKKNRHMQFDGCIYLTDGYASEPKVRPPCKLIWVVTSGGNESALKYGRIIKLPES